MILPLRDMLNIKCNRYELSKAIMTRANQIINNNALLPKENKDKIVSYAVKQVLAGEIKYSPKKTE